jgi:hypothetical protein
MGYQEDLPNIADLDNENVRIVVDDDGGWELGYDEDVAIERARRVLESVVEEHKQTNTDETYLQRRAGQIRSAGNKLARLFSRF